MKPEDREDLKTTIGLIAVLALEAIIIAAIVACKY